jgi:drug/metabolite transporter (DMT)-like permease
MLFDIRTIIGALLGLYGVILIGTGVVQHIRVDVWTGIVLAVVSMIFLTWVRVRPVKELTRHTEQSGPSE